MSTKSIGWAPGNRWFDLGFQQSIVYDLDGLLIRLLSLPYYMAAKFDAYQDRRRKDARTSHDFEDIVYLLNHVSDVREQIVNSDQTVGNYLKEMFSKILNDDRLQEAVEAHLYSGSESDRIGYIMSMIEEITDAIQ